MAFHRGPAPFRLMIDFTATLTAPRGDVRLEADPEHGGVQYRPADMSEGLAKKETIFVLPKEPPSRMPTSITRGSAKRTRSGENATASST